MKTHQSWILLLICVAAGTASCVDLNNSPDIQGKLKAVSAGYTGCAPQDNVLSNVAMHGDGSGIWNATCKGKIFLCSAVVNQPIAIGNESNAFHCAPMAQ